MDNNPLFKLTYGLYAVCSADKQRLNGYISNTVMQITAEPETIATSCSKNNLTHEMIQNSGIFSVSVISQAECHQVIGTFGYQSGRDVEKFAGVKHKIGKTGAPILLEDSIAWFDCRVIQTIDAGTHTIFIGEVVESGFENENDLPMTYTYFREVRKGKSPKNAPTFSGKESKPTQIQCANWVCDICGYEYDPAVGDPDNGIAPGTPFENLPDNWTCPFCRVTKDNFNKIEPKMSNQQDIWVCNVCGYEYNPAVGDPDSGIAPGTAFEDIPDDWACPLCGVSKSDFSKK